MPFVPRLPSSAVCHRIVFPIALLLAGSLHAEPATPGVSAGSIIQGVFGLLLIIGLLVGAAYALRRFGGPSALGHSGPIKIVAGLAVGTRERILLLEVEDNWIVVGVTATQMRTLHTLPKGKLPEGELRHGAPPFATWLKQFAERKSHER